MLSLKIEFQNEIKNETHPTVLYLLIRAPIRSAKHFRKQQLGIMRADSSAEAKYPESSGTQARNAMKDSAQQLDGRGQTQSRQVTNNYGIDPTLTASTVIRMSNSPCHVAVT